VIRTLLIAALVIWCLILVGRWIGRVLAPVQELRRAVKQARDQAQHSAARPQEATERLVACARCGTRVPASRALPASSGEFVFCSESCRNHFMPSASAPAAG
jgi:hypothetical protein